ncbi:MAG: RNA polymerase-binding protein DksA [Deltaproteobacteria bacterium]|nr:RNA polymerase-binding protein DksA [Deltaproteobacteria bacterium]
MKMEKCEDSSYARDSGFSHMKEAELFEDYMPLEDETYINPEQLTYFHRKFFSLREELASQLDILLYQMRGESAKEVEFLDQTTCEADTALKICSQDRAIKMTEEIDAALHRIEFKKHGYCEETEEEIGISSLEPCPTATLCLEAQHWLESGKNYERSIFQ